MRSVAIGLVLALGIASSGAAAPARSEIGVESSIDACWAASREDLHSDSTLRIGQGVSAVVACLEWEIVLLVEASQACAPACGTALNNVGGFYLAERLEDVLRDLAAGRRRPR